MCWPFVLPPPGIGGQRSAVNYRCTECWAALRGNIRNANMQQRALINCDAGIEKGFQKGHCDGVRRQERIRLEVITEFVRHEPRLKAAGGS